MTESPYEIEKTKAEILQAAQERFRTYGYGKTTMAEIASDVDMSAANLYRYFQNKQDIAAACAGRCMGDLHTLLENVTGIPDLTASQRLHMFVQTAMRYYHEMSHDTPRLNELIENLTQNNPELIHERNRKMESMLTVILQQGVDDGEYMVDDITETAGSVSKAIVLFTTPIFMPLFSIEEFEKMAVGVVTLIIKGLRKTN